MPPKRKQPSRVTRSGKAGNTTPLSNVKRRCQGFGPNRQSAAAGCTVPEEDTVLAGGGQRETCYIIVIITVTLAYLLTNYWLANDMSS